MSEVEQRHRKQLSVMRGWLEGRGYFMAMDALEVCRRLEQGTRKDQITPKFHHQLSIARLITTLEPHLIHPEATLTVCFLHDLLEDHPEWTREAVEVRFSKQVADAVWLLSKKTPGLTKDYEMYFGDMAGCAIASIVKPADRNHNILTMQGVFTVPKQQAYLAEVDQWFYPLIKTARRRFPQQYGAYENLKIILRIQCRLIRELHLAVEEAKGGLLTNQGE
jgi:(p)ppGpp synthase/HD superfamily hydrolase